MELTKNFTNFCESQTYSNYFIEVTRKINIYLTISIIIIGLIGNVLGIIVFLQKKIRSKPTSIYLLCLIVSDSFYLVMHFFEDTLKAFIEHYIHETDYIHEICSVNLLNYKHDFHETNINEPNNRSNQNWFISMNIIDRSNFFCRSINFARYYFRFTSAYIIVAFTIQRMLVLKNPFHNKKFESKKKTLFYLYKLCF